MNPPKYVKFCNINYLKKAIQNLLPVRECRRRQRLEQVPSCWRRWSSRRGDENELTRSNLILTDAPTYITLATGKEVSMTSSLLPNEHHQRASKQTRQSLAWFDISRGPIVKKGEVQKYIFNNRHSFQGNIFIHHQLTLGSSPGDVRENPVT